MAKRNFLDVILPNNNFTDKLHQLLANFPFIDIKAMGFPTEWETEPLWQ